MKTISGRSAVVTGAGTGMGRSIASALADAGANVVVCDIEQDAADAVASELRSNGYRALAVRADVSKLDEVQALAQTAHEAMGSIEILVNNAGVTLRPFRASWDTSYEDFRWLMDVNFWGVLHGHMAFVPRMMKTEGEKHIVNTSSVGSFLAVPGHSAYCASKGAVDAFSNCVREELKGFNIGLTLLHPGAVRTRIVTSERLRPQAERSSNRNIKPWSDYVREVTNPVVDLPTPASESTSDPDFAADMSQYITPKEVGRMVVEGILQNKPHVLTHPLARDRLQGRVAAILAGEPTPPGSAQRD